VAPLDVHLVATGTGAQSQTALELAERLAARGLRVLVDDRVGVSAGVKFTDAELIGIPRTVVIGRRLIDGYAELRDRSSGERVDVPVDDLKTLLAEGV
jgi:prolyl-tRNA synthetase